MLEHDHGAWLLGHLLLGDPLPGLGDEFALAEIAFQAHEISAVDDAVVTGVSAGGHRRVLALAVRRAPTIGMSDEKFVELWDSIVATTQANLDRVSQDSFRTGIVVAGPHGPSRQLAALARSARSAPSAASFLTSVAQGPAAARSLLERIQSLTAHALASVGTTQGGVDRDAAVWMSLKGNHPRECFLEGDDPAERSSMIGRLASASVTHDGLGLWTALQGLARAYIPSGATVDEALLRRDLAGVAGVLRNPRHQRAWETLDALSASAAAQVHAGIDYAGRRVVLSRDALREDLLGELATTDLLVVTGEPDSGKSALAAAVAEDLIARGGAVLSLNLRDLPERSGDLVAMLGAAPGKVFAGFEVAERRLLLIDGAEAVQESRPSTFVALVAAAHGAGLSVAAIGRSDAAAGIGAAMADAAGRSGVATRVWEVPALGDAEVAALVHALPELSTVAADSRSAWILTLPGLVEVLLRSNAVGELPAGPVAEADVLAAFWAGLVRNGELRHDGGATPDARESALLSVAARSLAQPLTEATDGEAIGSLRSDGILRARPHDAPWAEDDFGRDLIRDFAVAVLLDRRGFGPLSDSGAPRWAVRAARIAAQARLLRQGDREAARTELVASFGTLAATHGDRWADVPWEAMLGPRLAGALAEAWPVLEAGDGDGLRRVLRIARQRHGSLGAVGPLVAAPVAHLLLEHVAGWQGPRDLREDGGRFLLEWLAGLRRRPADTRDADRGTAKALLLEGRLFELDDEERCQALATLGCDHDGEVAAALRAVAAARPHALLRAVEDVDARFSLAVNDPSLLLELAEAYYIERPRPRRGMFDDYNPILEDGIRDHRFHGLGAPFAAPYYGPFRELLQVRPREAVSLINRLLDHAAAFRVAGLAHLDGESGRPPSDPSLELALLGLEGRSYRGDGHVWGWYRGNTVGPYPAMSALMALEDWADRLVQAGTPPSRLAGLMLEDAHSLAMAGLVYGFLVRHLEQVTSELDGYLSAIPVWQLEFQRVLNERGGLPPRRDEPGRAGADRRGDDPRQVAMQLVFRAVASGDAERREALTEIGRGLVAAADASGDPHHVAAVRQWAACLDPANYRFESHESGVRVEVRPPAGAVAALAEQNEDLRRGGMGWHLLTKYSGDSGADVPPTPEDVIAAMEYWRDPPASGPNGPAGPVSAVAAAMLRAHASGEAHARDEDLRWAIEVLANVLNAAPDAFEASMGSSRFAMGADRSAARGLPSTLLPAFHERASDGLRQAAQATAVLEALVRAATSPVDEVRRAAAAGLRPVWDAECQPILEASCRHEVALAIGLEAVRYARLGPRGESGRRQQAPLEGDLPKAVTEVAARDLDLRWLTPAVMAAADAARATSCQASAAAAALDVLLAAHRRALPHYLEHHYHRDDGDRDAFVIALLQEAALGRSDPLDRWLADLGSSPKAVEELLWDAARIATYDLGFRGLFLTVWPRLADAVLDGLDAGALDHERRFMADDAVARVIPAPTPRVADPDPGSTLANLGVWIPFSDVAPRMERWIPHAAGCARCADSLVGFVRTLPTEEQVTAGLGWMRRVVAGQAEGVASRPFLVSEWLSDLKSAGAIQEHVRSDYQVLVDALAAGGDRIAAELQTLEE